jgi:hypothetical protein
MADLLGLITGGLTAATNIGNARDEGMAMRRKQANDDLLARIEQERQDADSSARRDFMAAQTRSMNASADRPPARRTQYDAARGGMIDLDAGTFSPVQGLPSASETSRPRRTQIVDGQLVDLDTGRASPIQGYTPPAPKPSLPTEGERKAAAFYASGRFGYETLERILDGDDPSTPQIEVQRGKAVPGFIAQTAQRIGFGAGNVMTNDQVRQMRASALMVSDAWLRYTSGAAVPEQEVERFAESFIPRAGDDPGTLAIKSQARRIIINALEAGAGRALPQADDTEVEQMLAELQSVSPQAALVARQAIQRGRVGAGTQPAMGGGAAPRGGQVQTSTGRTFQRVP